MRFLYIYTLLFICVVFTSCGAIKRNINKTKTEEKTKTETNTVTNTNSVTTESTAATRTITEEFKDTLTVPSVSTSITSDEKKLSIGDTIRGETNKVLIKQYKNPEGKTITEFKTKPQKVNVPGKRTILENVSTVKTASVNSNSKQVAKQSSESKKSDYVKTVDKKQAVNWTIVVISLGSLLLLILIYVGWRFYKNLPKL